MKILFPTPVTWDGNVARYFQRDGGRLAQWVSENRHEGVKVIYSNDPSIPPPNTPLLAIGTTQQWLDPEFWKAFHADAALVYFGISPNRIPIVRAMKKAGLRVLLKMDSAWGYIPPFFGFLTLIRLDFFRHLENPSGREMMASMARKSDYLTRPDKKTVYTTVASFFRIFSRSMKNAMTFQRLHYGYFSLFDALTIELPYGEQNTRKHLRHLSSCPPIQLLPHPCLDAFRFSESDLKEKILLAVAGNWFYPTKGGKLLAQTLAITLQRHPDYHAIVVGHGAEDVKMRAEQDAGFPLPIEPYPFMKREALETLYRKAQIFVLPSGSEGSPNVIFEALASGCSYVFSSHIRQLHFALQPPAAATPAAHYTPTAFAAAIDTEIDAWASSQRSPIEISATYHKLAALSNVGQKLLDLISQL